MTETIVLEGVKLYYPEHLQRPDNGFGGIGPDGKVIKSKDLFFKATLGLSQDHVDALIAEGVSENVVNPKKKTIMPRFRSLFVKRADTELPLAVTLKRKAKDSTKQYTTDKTQAVNSISVDGLEENERIGDGTVADVTILLQRREDETMMYIGSVKVTELVPYIKQEEGASESDVEAARNKLKAAG